MKAPRYLNLILQIRRALFGFSKLKVTVSDQNYRSVFSCGNSVELYRALSIWEKEPGTMTWINSSVNPGDVFLDIGANIGIYSISAAHRLKNRGKVYACEPHKVSALALFENISSNQFEEIIDVLAFPLSSEIAVKVFNYKDLQSAVTGSQFGSNKPDPAKEPFAPVAKELAIAFSVDELIRASAISPPDLIKIDVDGLEYSILQGMVELLNSSKKPRSIQVELNIGEQEKIEYFMSQNGYSLVNRHFTSKGAAQKSRGLETSQIAHNAIFEPVAA